MGYQRAEKISTCRACVVIKRHAASPLPYESRFISSDDVFEHILHLREQNDARHIAAERAAHQWGRETTRRMKLDSREQSGYDAFLTHMEARHSTRGRFVRQRAQEAEREYSNGESAFIYDPDSRPVTLRPWYEPENVRLLHDFFLQHHDLFR